MGDTWNTEQNEINMAKMWNHQVAIEVQFLLHVDIIILFDRTII